jgi:hypothetical protein
MVHEIRLHLKPTPAPTARALCSMTYSQKAEELISLLEAMIKDEQEEVRIRMAFLAKKYAAVVGESKAAAPSAKEQTKICARRVGFGRVRSGRAGGGRVLGYFSFAYSAFASFRMGMLGSASFQRAKKSWYAVLALAVSLERA